MRSTFSILFYINRGKIKADGTTAVMCRITIDGRNTAITTGICCKPEDWNARTGTIRTVRENARLQEYRKYIEKDPALERRFQPVTVEEPTEDEAFQILKGLRPKYEEHHHVTITLSLIHI